MLAGTLFCLPEIISRLHANPQSRGLPKGFLKRGDAFSANLSMPRRFWSASRFHLI